MSEVCYLFLFFSDEVFPRLHEEIFFARRLFRGKERFIFFLLDLTFSQRLSRDVPLLELGQKTIPVLLKKQTKKNKKKKEKKKKEKKG